MPKKRSFGDVVWEKYADDIKKAVSEHTVGNAANLSLHSIIPYDTPGDTVKFDVLVTANAATCEPANGNAGHLFRLSCEALLDDGLKDFRIFRRSRRRRWSKARRTDGYAYAGDPH
jgi:hypothetical protein